MRNLAVFIIAFLTVAFVLLMGEAGKMADKQPDYQTYTKRLQQIEEATR